MTTRLIDLSQQPLPLRLLRVRQLRSHLPEPMLAEEFVLELEHPRLSESERFASAERLLFARRRAAG